MDSFPEILTHIFHPGRGAFRNLCELPVADAKRVLDEIRAAGRWTIKPNYLRRRLSTEDWLMEQSRRKLGPTRLQRPIYFFLGDFADGMDPSRPQSILIPLSAVPEDTITFTYPDSMASYSIGIDRKNEDHRKAYHGRVLTLAEIREVVAEHGMPGRRWQTEPLMKYDRFVECQLWDDRPLKPYREYLPS